ncbi:MAG TPA: hypothetical protein VKM55_23355 [Candidatus Lokiarchaeia archaeon]|nr:hypothetical protein [Candidatus Lokiarchaeia archaeon]
MTLSNKTIESLRDRSENDVLDLASGLQHVLNAIHRLEMAETDLDLLADLAEDGFETSKELQAVLAVLAEKLDDGEVESAE